jgi:undecaprenyl-diphosphatase
MPELWQAALLGVVQGLTEFLPISSTGHLILVPAILGWHAGLLTSLEFDVALHIGTLAALLAVFWREWASLVRAGFTSLWRRSLSDPNARLAWLIVLATIPGVLAGALFQRQVETALRAPLLVGVMMVGIGVVLELVDRSATLRRSEYSLGPAAALAIGLGQACALIPGVSRSGSTITVGLAAGLDRAAAARFSFLLSTPIVLGAVAKQSLDLIRHGSGASELAIFAVGIVTAALTGYACIRGLLAYLRTRTLLPFVIYRIVAGSAVILLAATGRL